MKILINDCYGGYSFKEEFREKFGMGYYSQETDGNRRRLDVIKAVENDKTGSFNDTNADIVVAEIPDEATDYLITDYDGMETLYYVVDGKICIW